MVVPLPLKSFQLFGSTYAYYVDNLNSEAIRVSAIPSGIRLTLIFPPNEVTIVGACVAGGCGVLDLLPKIVWIGWHCVDRRRPRAPWLKSLATSALCDHRRRPEREMWSGSSGDFFSDSACRLGLTSANQTIARLRPGIAAAVKDRVNDAGVQTSIADALKKYLVVGPGGEIAIKRRYERRKGTHDCIRPFERDWRIAGLAEHLRAERASWSGSFSVEVTGKFQRTRR